MRRVLVVVAAFLAAMSFWAVVSNVPTARAWSGTVYIRSDGTVEPFGAPINTTDKITYYLWDNISVSGYFGAGIVVERDNIILEGNGFAVQGSALLLTKGVNLQQRNNVTVKNLIVEGHALGINVYQSVNVKILANSLINNSWGIDLTGSSNNIISENIFMDNGYGIRLSSSSNKNVILKNNVTGPGHGIIIQENCNFNVVSENYLRGSHDVICTGISVGASENKILRNTITTYFVYGVSLSASKNIVYGNNITLNGGAGVNLHADNNTVAGNTIAINGFGIYIEMASNNRIYHNNFYLNGEDVEIENGVVNYFDGGYPLGGNYWKEHTGANLYHGQNQDVEGSDGIIDTLYEVSPGIFDRYPLSSPLAIPPAITVGDSKFNIEIVTNSTISDLYLNPEEGPFIKFNVSGTDGTKGFSRVTIPKALLWTENTWTIKINGEIIQNFLKLEDAENTYLYFTYNHSIKTITIQGTHIIPELQPSIIPPLFMVLSVLAVIFARKTRKREA